MLNDPVNFVDPEGLQKYNVTKPESHNGGRNHVPWGSKNSSRDNAVNQDGSTRHGKNLPLKVKDILNKKFGWDLKTPLINLLPFETYEQCVEWQMCGENGCNL